MKTKKAEQMNVSASQLKFIASLVMSLGGLVYLALKFRSHYGTFAIDFDYIWLSGKVWLNGQNPYDSVFVETAVTSGLFKGAKPPELFTYPPNWAMPAMAMAELRLETATAYWRGASIIAMALSVLLTFYASRYLAPSLQFCDALITLGYLFLMQAAPELLVNGQSNWVVLLGLSLILYGTAYKQTVLTVLGLTFVLLKPQIGIPILATLAAIPRLWPVIPLAGAVTLVLAAPAFAIGGVSDTVIGFLENLPRYSLFAINNPTSMTGIRNLIWESAQLEVNPIALVGVASLAAITSTVMLGWVFGQDTQIVTRALYVTLAIILGIVPLHTYDFVIVAPMVLVFLGHTHAARWLVLLALAMIFRSENVGTWTGFHGEKTSADAVGGLLNSLAGISLLIGCIWLLYRRPATSQTNTDTPRKKANDGANKAAHMSKD